MTKLFNKLYINVGAMKAGTTWLYRQLEKHPDIAFSYEKELHYLSYRDGNNKALERAYKTQRRENAITRFEGDKSSSDYAELLKWYDSFVESPMNDEWYRQRFPYHLTTQQYCADFSNLTCLVSQAAWKEILAIANVVKVTYILRDPYDRIWSQFKVYHQSLQHKIHVSTLTEADFLAFDKTHKAMLHSTYSQHIARMQELLANDMLKIIAYDDIQLRPDELLHNIEDFLGIKHYQYQPRKIKRKINVSESLSAPPSFYKAFSAPVEKELNELKRFGINLPTKVIPHLH